MAAFPGSPAPRKTNRTTPRFSPPPRRVVRVGSSKPASRFGTPTRAAERERLSLIRDDASVTSGMDVDDGGSGFLERGLRPDTVLAKSDELLVSFHAQLPAEVKQILQAADFFRDAYTGAIDTMTGFALVATFQTCFVWQYNQALTGIPTCYIFSCPMDQSQTAPLHAFVPYGITREPGLILISASGDIRFWDSISIGLAGGEHFQKTQVELETRENVTSLTRSDPQTYIVSTSKGHLFRLTLTSSGGKYHLTARTFSRPTSSMSFSRFLPSLWSSQMLQPKGGNVTAIALGEHNSVGRDLWALVDSRIQKWNLAREGWEEIVQEEDVASVILPVIKETLPNVDQNTYLDLELLDVAVEASGQLVFLTSYSGTIEDGGMGVDMTPRRIYALVRVSGSPGFLSVEKIITVPYQSTFGATEAPMHPKMQLVAGGALLVVQFGDAVTICARDNAYKDRIELKSSSDRTLGVGVVEDQPELLVLTASAMIKASIDFDQVSQFDPETGRSKLIKSIMTQAILYGSHPENPLHFSFPPEVDEESLMSGAEQLSRAVLESDHEVVRPNNDLTSQMTARRERLSFLIKFINENGVLGKISQASRQRLAFDAERLYAAQQLWLSLNEFLSRGHQYSVLNEAVYNYMNAVGEGHHEDFMRAFFRLRISDLGKLLSHVMDILRRHQNEAPGALQNVLAEVNGIFLNVLTSAFEFRQQNSGVYGLEPPLIKPWTSRMDIILALIELFDVTANITPTAGSSSDAKAQLPQLASVLFACMTERLSWMKVAAVEELASDRELTMLEERFQHLRPEVMERLCTNGFADHAFKLAERYRDFRSLASLCNKDTTYPPEQNPNALSIQAYIERFRDEFTEELYQWYIEHGELRSMFATEVQYSDYMDRFFAKRPYTSISWIHDLHQTRYEAAAESLLSDSQDVGELAAKQLMLSIGKLSHLAHLQENEGADDESLLDAFHDGLDFVSVHETLADELKSALASIRVKQSLDAQVDTIVKAKASRLADWPSLILIFRSLVRLLVQGKALSVEEVSDVLSLKDNTKTVEDYATALHLLARADNLPEARKLAEFRSIWRRIYIHDDWDRIRHTVGVTDAELNERFRSTALFTALSATLPKRHQPAGYILSPAQALPVPTHEEMASRWPRMSAEEREALAADYRAESERLERYDLNDAFERAKELVLEQFMWGQGS